MFLKCLQFAVAAMQQVAATAVTHALDELGSGAALNDIVRVALRKAAN